MTEPRPVRGARAPLFERLADSEPDSIRDAAPLRVHAQAGLRESVRRDLARFLNTRASFNPAYRLAEGTVLDYGIPDLSAFTPESEDDRRRLAALLAARIAAHEPRLTNVRVAFHPPSGSPVALKGVIHASLRIGSVVEPVYFPLAIDHQSQAEGAVFVG
jgi:type VI secretion system protein ImpF